MMLVKLANPRKKAQVDDVVYHFKQLKAGWVELWADPDIFKTASPSQTWA